MKSLTRLELRDVDRCASEEFGLAGLVLMENAGCHAAELLAGLPPLACRVCVVCGKGNNAGDGFVIARHLDAMGIGVRLLLALPAASLTGDAAVNYSVVERAGLPVEDLSRAGEDQWRRALGAAQADWIVDALLGTGAVGVVSGPVATAIAAINAVRQAPHARLRVFAVDLPSGMDCDSGLPLGRCVRADVTATFVAQKAGFDAVGAAEFTGPVHLLGIGVPRVLLERMGLAAEFNRPGVSAAGTSTPRHP